MLYCVYLEGHRLIIGSKSFELSVTAFGDHRALQEAVFGEMIDMSLRC